MPKTWPKKETSILNQNRKHKNYLLISTPTNKGQPWKNNYPFLSRHSSKWTGLKAKAQFPKKISHERRKLRGMELLASESPSFKNCSGIQWVDARGWTDEFTQTQNEPAPQQPARVEQDNLSKNPKARILNSHGGQLTLGQHLGLYRHPVASAWSLASRHQSWESLSLGAFELTGKNNQDHLRFFPVRKNIRKNLDLGNNVKSSETQSNRLQRNPASNVIKLLNIRFLGNCPSNLDMRNNAAILRWEDCLHLG